MLERRRLRFAVRTAVATAAVATVALALCACKAPVLELRADPPDASLAADGVELGQGPSRDSVPYYGVMQVDAVPAWRTRDDDPKLLPARRTIDLSEPYTPWVFPFDFLLEVASYPFGADDVLSFEIELPEQEQPIPRGVVPAARDEVLQRARAAAVER